MTDQIRHAQRRLIYHTITQPSAARDDDQAWALLPEGHVRAVFALTSGEMLRRWFGNQRPDAEQVSALCDLLSATGAIHDCHVDFDPELTGALVEGAFGNLAGLMAHEDHRTAIIMIAIAVPSLLAMHMNYNEYAIAALVDTIDSYIRSLPTDLF